MPPVIDAKDLYKCYPGFPPVLRGVNITVEPGEMVAIMGPSGCGKSTMLHILGMLHAPDSGSLEILGQNVLKLNSDQTSAFRRGNMGFVMQASNLFEHSTVFENVEFPLIYENVPAQERWERVIRALDLVRLSSRVHYRSNRLSGGEQQRVAIARAMVNNPRILLADEPTGALDARTSAVIMENFRSLCHNGGVAMVMVTHDPKMAEYCDSIYTLEEGQLRCKKHQPPKVSATSAAGFLKPPDPVVRGALIAWRFPAPHTYAILELARRLHNQDLLGRIYSLTRNAFLSGQKGYSLPLVVRHIGFWQSLFGTKVSNQDKLGKIAAALQANHGFFASLWRKRALGAGAILAKWSHEDNIEFLYAAGARKVAAATWVASKLLNLPFAFALQPEDMPLLGKNARQRAKDAAFITCSTGALADAFQKFAPDIPKAKILVLPNPPRFVSLDETPEPGLPPAPDKPLHLLAMSPESNPAYFSILLAAISMLKKKGLKFRLMVLGKASIFLRWRLFLSGLGRQIKFTGLPADDNLAESFRTADIFIAWAPKGAGMELAMPWPVCEAMAFGLPIIAMMISPGMAPLSGGRNCLIADNAQNLATEVEKIANTPELEKSLGAKAREDIRAFLDLAGLTKALSDKIVEAAGEAEYKENQKDGV